MRHPNGSLVMTTCECREITRNLVMTRVWFEEQLANKVAQGERQERYRILQLLKGLRFSTVDGVQQIELSKDDLIALVEGKEND
jgi:hypothetical protein